MTALSEQLRVLPDHPSLRFLKIEAKRRLAAGEFPTLHDAQLAIAREHGTSSWAVLKAAVEAGARTASHAAAQVTWVVQRFRDAPSPGWLPPAPEELAERFDESYLRLVPAPTLIDSLRSVAGRLQQEIVVLDASADRMRGQVSELRIEAATHADAPHRITTLRVYPVVPVVADSRTSRPPTAVSGTVPREAERVASDSFTELGLVGLVVAGGDPAADDAWSAARGWADLDRSESLRTDHRFPAHGVSKLITATAVLRLVAHGLVDLDRPANHYLRSVRLADDDASVRELLAHTAGVVGPRAPFADKVPDQVEMLGGTVACTGRHGVFAPSNGGYAVLGQLVADLTEEDYVGAVTRLVLGPLGMASSGFPTAWPLRHAVTGYELAGDGSFSPSAPALSTTPAAGGLWTTAPDLVRFALGWTTILPDELSDEAVRPQAPPLATGAVAGLGWVVNPPKGLHGHPGAGPGGAASLVVQQDTGTAIVVMTSRTVSVESVSARLVRPVTPGPGEGGHGARR